MLLDGWVGGCLALVGGLELVRTHAARRFLFSDIFILAKSRNNSHPGKMCVVQAFCLVYLILATYPCTIHNGGPAKSTRHFSFSVEPDVTLLAKRSSKLFSSAPRLCGAILKIELLKLVETLFFSASPRFKAEMSKGRTVALLLAVVLAGALRNRR